jgi:hypothetical protein
MIDALSLYAKAVTASAVGVAATVAAEASPPAMAPWMYGGAALAFLSAVWGYGKLHGRIEAGEEREKERDARIARIEDKLDRALPQLAIAIDRTEGK